MKKRFAFFVLPALLVMLSAPQAGAQELLDNQNASWSTVLPGTVVSAPAVTSYGLCIATDARTVTALSHRGTQIWEKSFSRTKNAAVVALPYDFVLFVDKDKSMMKLINPSGNLVWEKTLPFKTEKSSDTLYVLPGRDGRFFVSDKDNIVCYGMNGVPRWNLTSLTLKTTLKTLPPQELPDGSVIFFTPEKSGMTGALRVSPFGEVLEEITFSGEVTESLWCTNGVLLAFKDGGAGLFSLEEGRAKNRWVFEKKSTGIRFAVHEARESVCILLPEKKDELSVHVINPSNGKTVNSFSIKNIDSQKLTSVFFNDSGLFLSDRNHCLLYKTDGTLLWNGVFESQKQKSEYNYMTYTPENYLILCRKNWTLDAYRLSQKSARASNSNGASTGGTTARATGTSTGGSSGVGGSASRKNSRTSYPDYIQIDTSRYSYSQGGFPASVTDDSTLSALKAGGFAEDESGWAEDILSACYTYASILGTSEFGTRTENSVFDDNAASFEKVLEKLPYLATADSAECVALVIQRTNSTAFLNALLKGIGECGYDPDGKILSALEIRAAKIDSRNVTSIQNICNAVTSICLYMGAPAYFSKGSNILKNFMSPNYDAKTRDYVRSALKVLF